MKAMEELAQKLDGREYLREITKEEEAWACEVGLLILFGRSDDNIEARGIFDDEIGMCEGVLALHSRGFLEPHDDCECEFCGYDKAAKGLPTVSVMQCADIMWRLSTDLPHETFVIKDKGEHFCLGLVINARNLPLL